MRDLGVKITINLKWGRHAGGLINKCNRTMGMIGRAVGFMLLLMLPPLLVNCTVHWYEVAWNFVLVGLWPPGTVSDIKAIE